MCREVKQAIDWAYETHKEEGSGMSIRYQQEIASLTDWFAARMKNQTIEMTKAEFNSGCDSLPEPYKASTGIAFELWLSDHNYELSYQQMCSAFFDAIQEVGTLIITDAEENSS